MRAFLEKVEKDYLDDFVFISKYQLQNLGVEIIDFDGTNLKSLDKYEFDLKNDIVIGSVEATCLFFKKCGIEPPKYLGYPESLKKYLERKITTTTVGQLSEEFPYFIKPKNDVKLFTGTLVENHNQLNIFKTFYKEVNDDTELYISEPVNFLSEYRCFVHKGELQGIHWYKGDFKIFPNVRVIESMIQDYVNAPVSYTLDVGIVKDMWVVDKIALIEVNHFWALGSYGFDAKKYVRMTIDCFREIYKNSLALK